MRFVVVVYFGGLRNEYKEETRKGAIARLRKFIKSELYNSDLMALEMYGADDVESSLESKVRMTSLNVQELTALGLL
jgi:hypothetical protein